MRIVRMMVLLLLMAAALMTGAVASATNASASVPRIPGIPDCKEAPTPERPGSGLAGALDAEPDPAPASSDPFVSNPSTSVYDQYGYAGLTWHTYDLGCGGSVRDPAAATDTMIGNVLLSTAVWLTAATNGLHNNVADPASYMGPLDRVVATVTDRLREAIWSPWGAVALVGVAAMLLFQAMRGHFPAVVAGAAWAVLVLCVVAAITQYPSRASSFFDDTITSTIGSIQARTAGVDSSTAAGPSSARAQGALTVDRVLYDSWLRGQLGSSDSVAAKRWGPDLFRASAVSRSEAAAATTPEAIKQLTEGKARQWSETADQIAEDDPATYAIVQGKAGGRMGVGLMALVGAACVDLFRLVADVFLLAGLVMLRLLVMFLPAAAVIGVFAPLSGVVKQMANIGGAAVVNVVAFSAGSVVYTAATSAVLSTADDVGMGIMALVLCLVITLAAFILMAPLLSFTRIFGHPGRPVRRHRLGRQLTRYVVTRQGVNAGTKRAMEDVQDDAPEPTEPAEPTVRRAASVPRSESFVRGNVVWDVTSDGGLTQARPSLSSRASDDFAPTRRTIASGLVVEPSRPAASRPHESSTVATVERPPLTVSTSPSHAQPFRPVTAEGVSATTHGFPDKPAIDPHLQLVKSAHDGNTQVAGDGAGYFVYDPRSGAMLRRTAEDEARREDAS